MSIFDLPIAPQAVTMDLIDNSGVSPSAFTGGAQTIARGGFRWVAGYTWAAINGDDRAVMMGFIASLRGRENRVRLPVYDNPTRGSYGGTPLVAGASQTGSTITIDGAGSVTNWIKAGDYFSIIVNGEPELKMCTGDRSSVGGDIFGLPFEPRMRASPGNNNAIRVADGVLTPPAGIFMMVDNQAGWSSRPGDPSKVSAIALTFVEDIYATQ
jgi:hypothetical protein